MARKTINASVAKWVAHCNPQLSGRELDKAVLQYRATIPPGCHFLDSGNLKKLSKLFHLIEELSLPMSDK